MRAGGTCDRSGIGGVGAGVTAGALPPVNAFWSLTDRQGPARRQAGHAGGCVQSPGTGAAVTGETVISGPTALASRQRAADLGRSSEATMLGQA